MEPGISTINHKHTTHTSINHTTHTTHTNPTCFLAISHHPSPQRSVREALGHASMKAMCPCPAQERPVQMAGVSGRIVGAAGHSKKAKMGYKDLAGAVPLEEKKVKISPRALSPHAMNWCALFDAICCTSQMRIGSAYFRHACIEHLFSPMPRSRVRI
jgi:hypothetical protein